MVKSSFNCNLFSHTAIPPSSQKKNNQLLSLLRRLTCWPTKKDHPQKNNINPKIHSGFPAIHNTLLGTSTVLFFMAHSCNNLSLFQVIYSTRFPAFLARWRQRRLAMTTTSARSSPRKPFTDDLASNVAIVFLPVSTWAGPMLHSWFDRYACHKSFSVSILVPS